MLYKTICTLILATPTRTLGMLTAILINTTPKVVIVETMLMTDGARPKERLQLKLDMLPSQQNPLTLVWLPQIIELQMRPGRKIFGFCIL
jgi:hypothetical protein